MNQQRKSRGAAAGAGLVLVTLACTCGPLQGLSDTAATLDSAGGTLSGFATEVEENLPTFQAELTQMAPTLTAIAEQGQAAGPTLTALAQQMPGLNATMTAAMGTLQAGMDGTGGDVREDGLHQWASGATASSEYSSSWAATNATGAPDTPVCGDMTTAWASGSSTGVDWLELTYDTPVVPLQIVVYETYNVGAVSQVEVIDTSGNRHSVYQAQPTDLDESSAGCPYLLVIDVTGVNAPVDRVVVTVDQSTWGAGWDEIDAVELIGNQ